MDYSNTRCLIDADGTLFDSLPLYNKVIDDVVRYKLTDRSYNDYWSEFNETYDIIPGCPWKIIFKFLIEFLGYPTPTDEELDSYIDQFNEGCEKMFATMERKDFAIEPVVSWCEDYVANGGELVIHSGTNKRVLEAMLEAAGIKNLFTDYINSDTLDLDYAEMGKWGYKTALVSYLKEKYPDNGRKDFVMGDTKGDGFGAYECETPFALVWRGYPKMPYTLGTEEDGISFHPDIVIDMRQEILDNPNDARNANVKAGIEELSEWAQNRCSGMLFEQQTVYRNL